jgi:hypothetical protein
LLRRAALRGQRMVRAVNCFPLELEPAQADTIEENPVKKMRSPPIAASRRRFSAAFDLALQRKCASPLTDG